MQTNRHIGSRELKIISLSISIMGIIILAYSTEMHNPQQIQIKDITENMQGDCILVCGIVKKSRNSNNMLFMELESNKESIDIIFFNIKNERTIPKYTELCVKGTVEIYKEKTEIIGKKIIEKENKKN
ncbi:MAG: OB-fold nucleic acid binding domain-containing protein [archaeon]|nr:OB-fold nucleic acid binding domain-containing protein [archaeon]